MKRVLIACEFSGAVRDAFIARGHDAWSCDLLPSETSGPHYQGDVREMLSGPWDLIIAHPECTYITNSSVKWLDDRPARPGILTGVKRWRALWDACEFFRLFINHPCPQIAVENPIPHRYGVRWIGRNYDQLIQPWQFGHPETKATCLWLKGLPKLKPTLIVDGRSPRVHHESPGPERQKNRSRTLSGIAAAMAEQWGSYLEESGLNKSAAQSNFSYYKEEMAARSY